MAGGKITRIVGGINRIECDSWNVYTDEFNASSGGKSVFTADEGTHFGAPKEPPPAGKYFVKGWWTDENGNEIEEAKLGDKVQFHVKMRNIYPINGWEKEFLEMELREFDGNSIINIFTFGLTSIKNHDIIELVTVKNDGSYEIFRGKNIPPNMEIICNITLVPEGFTKFFKEEVKDDIKDKDKDLELYMHCRYYSERHHEYEVVDLPLLEFNYLIIKAPTIVEPIVFVEASDIHRLPAIYSAEDGNPWYINFRDPISYVQTFNEAQDTAEDIEMIRDYFSKGKEYESEKIDKWSKRSYDIAIRKLEKGKLIFNDGSKGFTNRYHKYTVSDIDGRYNRNILMGVNRGKFKKGITSKGINQLEVQAGRGMAKVFKTVGELNPLWDAISDLADILTAAANGERPPLPFTPPFISWEIDRMMANLDETIIRQWNDNLQKAIKQDLKAVSKVISSNINDHYNLGFSLITISEEVLIKIITSKLKEYDRSSASFDAFLVEQSQGKKEVTILVQKVEDKDIYNRITYKHYIHAIYLNDLKL